MHDYMDPEMVSRITPVVRPLLDWYNEHKRSLPWREAPSPYHVWISEIMLQQTRIEAVMDYYRRFLDRLPTVVDLAEVPEDELLKLWEGLGYYSRARNLKKAAVRVTEEFGGELPPDYELLVSLPGIGNYTAGAIASIAYGLPEPAVDGNVLRVLMRFLNRDDDVMSQKLRREAEETLRAVMRDSFGLEGKSVGRTSGDNPAGDFTQALMELGEVICIPNGEPLCEKCPLKESCLGLASGRAVLLPVRKAKTKRRIEKRTVFVIRDEEGRIFIRRRPDSGLLAGLWELPSAEGHIRTGEVPETVRRILAGDGSSDPVEDGKKPSGETDEEMTSIIRSMKKLPPARHVFSHIEWDMIGFEVTMTPHHIVGGRMASPHDLDEKYALPTAFSAYRLRE